MSLSGKGRKPRGMKKPRSIQEFFSKFIQKNGKLNREYQIGDVLIATGFTKTEYMYLKSIINPSGDRSLNSYSFKYNGIYYQIKIRASTLLFEKDSALNR